MKDEQFDKEVSDLYQQRKSKLVAPNINLAGAANIKKYSLLKLFSIFTLGGFASFGIMAFITHFAKGPSEHNPKYISPSHQIEIAEEPEKQVDDIIPLIEPKLPPKPELPKLVTDSTILVPVTNEAKVNKVEDIGLHVVQIVKLPHLKEPEFLIKPIYKVMPKFSNKALQQKPGSIRLRYEIDSEGKVKNIKVIKSEVSRELQRSAKKALAKWKYAPNQSVQETHEIIFEFNPVE